MTGDNLWRLLYARRLKYNVLVRYPKGGVVGRLEYAEDMHVRTQGLRPCRHPTI